LFELFWFQVFGRNLTIFTNNYASTSNIHVEASFIFWIAQSIGAIGTAIALFFVWQQARHTKNK
jgi:glycerol uptake facilitator-like aquaporin